MTDLSLQSVNILAVDDDPIALTIYKSALSGLAPIDTFSDPLEALESARQKEYAVMLVDWIMPGLDGLQFCEEIRKLENGDIPVIVLVTAANRSSELNRVLTAGADDYIGKPVEPDGLSIRVQIAIDRYRGRIERSESQKYGNLMLHTFDNTQEGIVITDPSATIQYVNKAFTEITGYLREEAIGQNPKLLASGVHDEDFYKNMWGQLSVDGQWQGEIWNKKKDGSLYPEWLTIQSVKDDDGSISHYIASFSDISSKKQFEDQLRYLSLFDRLTGLANRGTIADTVERAIRNASRSGEKLAVLYVDLDRFKIINDSLAHGAGDQLLRKVAERLRDTIPDRYSLGRYGGDEFVAILDSVKMQSEVRKHAEDILSSFQNPFRISDRELFVSVSIGIALFPEDGSSAERLLQHADVAMYRAKAGGRNSYEFYEQKDNIEAVQQLTMETELRNALQRSEMFLVLQPILDASRNLIGAESLVRWENPKLGNVGPDKFVPVAEATGMITEIGSFVLKESCRLFSEETAEIPDELYVSVNVSAIQFQQKNFTGEVFSVIETTGLDPARLQLEMTETSLASRIETTLAILRKLRSLGIRLAVDDFGTGFSSLQYLKQFPIDSLKIDRSFVIEILSNQADRAIAKAIIALAHVLGLKVIAEGIETEDQFSLLSGDGCDTFQGYYFGKPMPVSEFTEYANQMKNSGKVRSGYTTSP